MISATDVHGYSNLLFALTDGGTGGLFWGFTVTIFACVFIYLSMAEMASMSAWCFPRCQMVVNKSVTQFSYCRWAISLGLRVFTALVSEVSQLHHRSAILPGHDKSASDP